MTDPWTRNAVSEMGLLGSWAGCGVGLGMERDGNRAWRDVKRLNAPSLKRTLHPEFFSVATFVFLEEAADPLLRAGSTRVQGLSFS